MRFCLGRVIFVPNSSPPHKKAYEVTPAEHRYRMAALATASHPHFETSRIEIDRSGPSYSVDTMRAFRDEFGPDAKLYFITGVDALIELLTWRQPDLLVELCELIAVTRPGYPSERLTGALDERMLHHIQLLKIPGVAISSTELRERVASGRSLRYLTPISVIRYIEEHYLYGNERAVKLEGGAWSNGQSSRRGLLHGERQL